jgi:glutamine amidotransferase
MTALTLVVDHGVGNTVAITNLLRKMGVSALRIESRSDLINMKYTDAKFILPGVGSFDSAMQSLRDSGIAEILIEHAKSDGCILGICLGMQLLLDSSEEGKKPGLGIIPGKAIKMIGSRSYPVPHVGWEKVKPVNNDRIFENVSKFRFYHNHSYALTASSPYSIATINYSEEHCVAARKENAVGVQFHPEKSHSEGERILRNFLYQ